MKPWIISMIAATAALLLASSAFAQYGFSDGSFDTQGSQVRGYCYFSAGTCPTGVWSGTHATGFIETDHVSWGYVTANSARHYAFVQNAGQLSQTFTATRSGSFIFTWFEADRPGLGSQTYYVRINGQQVGSFSPSSTSFTKRESSIFSLVAGTSYTVTFEGTSPNADRSALIDSVTLLDTQYGFNDGGFDAQGSQVGGYCYFSAATCPAGAWSGTHATGIIETSHVSWGNVPANSPRHSAFVQIAGQLSQTFTAKRSGSFYFTWFDADRPGLGGQTYRVKINGTQIGSFSPSSTTFTKRQSSNVMLVAGSSYTLTFEGMSPGEDKSALIDSVGLFVTTEQSTFSYDALGRLTRITTTRGVNAGVSRAYEFDSAGNRRTATVSGVPQ